MSINKLVKDIVTCVSGVISVYVGNQEIVVLSTHKLYIPDVFYERAGNLGYELRWAMSQQSVLMPEYEQFY